MSISMPRTAAHSIHSSTLADVLERILDKGLVIAGDIKIKLVDIELLTIQIRLVVASVDKAREMGLDWWNGNRDFCSRLATDPAPLALPLPMPIPTLAALAEGQSELQSLRGRVALLEQQLTRTMPSTPIAAVQ
jgi:hypothetical protein